ncbi:DapH/DapD/GlmU-related protein [uncultured Chitinophaga sp.]|uniref:acyltransferase n=1 Tax=uncultured Chitinophaga sp. TaxID=339340 RepID=UPI0025E64B28|nr:acyltransferase [uncultured Chitinophaga sp.]
MRYLRRILGLIYNILNAAFYKSLHHKAIIYYSVRVGGKKYLSIGKNTVVQRHGWLWALKYDDADPILEIGSNCAIGDFSHIVAIRSVRIDDDVLIANNVYISDNLHEYADIAMPVKNQPLIFKGAVKIGSGAWIGENACIIGASVGKNSVVGANAVVTSDIPDYCIAVGSPARVIKRFDATSKTWVKV